MDDVWTWFYDSSDNALMVAVSVVGIFLILGICTRFGRLRSLSQMTGFDFGVNVAIGSIIAATVLSPDPSLFQAAVSLVTIFAMQVIYSTIRRRSDSITNPSSQNPHVVWVDGGFVEDHMKATKYTRSDIYHAMRTSTVSDLDDVRFVIVEATGDVSVYTGEPGAVSDVIFEDVVGREMIPGYGVGEAAA